MSKKTLLMLAVVLAALIGVWWKSGREAAPAAGSAESTGGKLLENVDLSGLTRLTIGDGNHTTRLARVEGAWRVEELEGDAADLGRLREMIRIVDEMDGGQVVDESAERLAEYGLAAEGDAVPLRLVFEHGGGTTVLVLGKVREPRRSEDMWGPPPGRYVRVDEGPVRLVKDDIPQAQADPDQWWDRQVLAVEPSLVQRAGVTTPEGAYQLERTTNGTYEVADAGEGEEVDAAAAGRLFGALRSLRANRRVSWTEEETEKAFAEAAEYRAEAEGKAYRVQIGKASEGEGGGRPVRVARDEEPWGRVVLVPEYLADALSLARSAVVRNAAPPAEESTEKSTEEAVEESTAELSEEPVVDVVAEDSAAGSATVEEEGPPPVPEAPEPAEE